MGSDSIENIPTEDYMGRSEENLMLIFFSIKRWGNLRMGKCC